MSFRKQKSALIKPESLRAGHDAAEAGIRSCSVGELLGGGVGKLEQGNNFDRPAPERAKVEAPGVESAAPLPCDLHTATVPPSRSPSVLKGGHEPTATRLLEQREAGRSRYGVLTVYHRCRTFGSLAPTAVPSSKRSITRGLICSFHGCDGEDLSGGGRWFVEMAGGPASLVVSEFVVLWSRTGASRDGQACPMS